ncbi:CinA family protein [Nitrogeniibacter mangrovi]|uniref:CinA family protein n=1 Tax=Nitrogeniibacter mangrovi TaxID=2016596 RepID=A0A6C1B0I5_9RHOO|nr:nicotinamide-nucleotide amidohydrolase family protein [Nitrogeniibacter mangrovi]QID16509.1 CinA family protein [Nitrogeniibacter mangrovi]
MDNALTDLARRTGELLERKGWILSTAESCTGGWIAEAITAIPGSSGWFDCGFVTYSNTAKTRLLGVPPALLATHGAVSEAVVRAMVAGALAGSEANVAVAVSGVAGPTGGSPAKPVGTVCLAWAWPGAEVLAETCHFEGDREAIRRQTVIHALRVILYKST